MKRVFIDPGHGGSDPGALGYNLFGQLVKEKDIVLPIAQLARRCLIERGFDVRISRNEDKYVTIRACVDEANAWPADAYLSIHSNARPSGEVRGVEIESYWLKPIELDYTRKIHHHLINGMREEYLPDVGISVMDRGIKTANFMVLRETKMISCLVEVGFVSDVDDVDWLSSINHQRIIARLLCEGIDGYFKNLAVSG